MLHLDDFRMRLVDKNYMFHMEHNFRDSGKEEA